MSTALHRKSSVEMPEVKGVTIDDIHVGHGSEKDLNLVAQLLPLEELLLRLDAGASVNTKNPNQSPGLSSKDATSRLSRDGPNELTPPPELPEIVKYVLHYKDPMHLLLLASGVLSCIIYGLDPTQPINLWLGLVLFGVTILSATFSYVQEGRSSAVMKVPLEFENAKSLRVELIFFFPPPCYLLRRAFRI
jgi:hypothetical protein